jgi:hypothetical protein
MGRNRADHTKSIVAVPNIVGLTVADGLKAAAEAEVVLTAADSNGPSVQATPLAHWRIIWQLPSPGSRRNRGEQVLVGFDEHGGGWSGVREPRRPLPNPLQAAARHEDDQSAAS